MLALVDLEERAATQHSLRTNNVSLAGWPSQL
jgi:hypothetical protein